MNDQKGPDAGGIVAGIFLVLFGLCITLLGGGCTIMFLAMIPSMGQAGSGFYEAMPLFLLSLVTLGAGIALIWLGVKLMTGGFRK